MLPKPTEPITKKGLKEFIQDECIFKGDFQLKNGQRTDTYLDLRRLNANPLMLTAAARLLAAKIPVFEWIIATPMSAIPVSTLISGMIEIPLFFGRYKKPHHMPPPVPDKTKVGIVIDDVVTTGASILQAHECLDVKYYAYAAIVDRRRGVHHDHNTLFGHGFYHLFTMSELAEEKVS